MTLQLRKILPLLSGVLFFFSVWLLWPRDLDGFGVGKDGKATVPDYAMTNARYVSVKNGRVEMESFSQSAFYNIFDRRMDGMNVRAVFYNQEDLPTEVTADKAFFYQNERKMILQDHVESKSHDGFIFRSSRAEYFADKRFLLSPNPVEGESQDKAIQIWGDRAESKIDSKEVDLFGNARAQVKDKKHGLTKIRGESAHLDRAEQKVTFKEKVRVEQGKLTGDSVTAHLFYSPKDRTVSYMSLLDDVRIEESGGRRTRSQVAEFFAPTDTIVLSGFPSVYHGDDVVTGDRITLYRVTGVVEVTATNAVGNPAPSTGKKPAFTSEDEELIP